MKQTFKTILIVFLCLLIGLDIIVCSVLLMPNRFDDTYFGEMADKYELLRMETEPKIVVIGGSSVAFGIDSSLIEQYLDMPVINFGLYGPLGTNIMLDLTRGYIHEGDIVIIAAETDNEEMSMNFNAEAFWQCVDSDYTMLFKIRGKDKWGEMFGAFWSYAGKKLNFYRSGKAVPEDVYDHASFDENGDMKFERNDVKLEDWVDEDVPINLDPEIIEDEFLDYVNDYIAYCNKQGATVYWSYPPMNVLAVQQEYEEQLEFATYLREHLDCQIISNISDYIMWPGYFYDTNYHVNDRGVNVHTKTLIQDLKTALGEDEVVAIETMSPFTRENPTSLEPSYDPTLEPGYVPPEEDSSEEDQSSETTELTETTPTPTPTPAEEEVTGSSKDAAYFLTTETESGLKTTGLTEEGKALEEIEVPWEIDGVKVTEIGENTFQGATYLSTINIQSNIERIYNGAFSQTPSLKRINIDNEGQNVLVASKGLFDGVSSMAKVYVAKANYGSYIADYFWGNYMERIVSN